MSLEHLTTFDSINQFLEGTQAVAFSVVINKQERYRWVQKTLVKYRYLQLGKSDKGLVTRLLMKVTGYSRAQIKRLIRQYVETGTVTVKRACHNGFNRRYTDADIRLLARMDELHQQPSGAVLKKLCERAYTVFEEQKYCPTGEPIGCPPLQPQRFYNLSASALYSDENESHSQSGSDRTTV